MSGKPGELHVRGADEVLSLLAMGESPQTPSVETVEWAKGLIAVPFTEALVGELSDLVRSGSSDRAEMAAWALAFGETPEHLRGEVVEALVGVLADVSRPESIRGQAAEAVAEQLGLLHSTDPRRHPAEAQLIEMLTDASEVVRFWSAFALGTLRSTTALPHLRALAGDDTAVPGWWTVGEEAADSIDMIEGREPPERDRPRGS
jgi:HEAT repeat protein